MVQNTDVVVNSLQSVVEQTSNIPSLKQLAKADKDIFAFLKFVKTKKLRERAHLLLSLKIMN
jgi:hypothetical protein